MLNQQESSPKSWKRTAQSTARNSAALRSRLSSKQPPKLVGKERSFQEVSNATKNSKNGGRNQREMAIESDVDWAVKMRIRPPELETSICDAKYHVSLHIDFTTRNINMSIPKAVYRSSIRTSNQLKSQSDLTRARHQQSAEVCFLTGSRKAQPMLSGSSNLPKQLASQLKTKQNLLTAYCQGSILLTTTQHRLY
ncbi:vacuolar protein sorting-associated protein 13B-like [Dorcoceras hygrometricum]|uniref:Vacuolar protein sorting-associated protein 13B-like n=1 Tax=Dorcoceras hygrometricum TaxID=472368 RepID=A0A2Z7ARU5_9LAMI|nr:vacuolar protein sorting-associated protein 13B-like [Dorcoceras hygrometricum]